ncbi:MAG TPA: amino acid ABC transporter permease [Desulfobacteraceae bacterium]|nr:amino acid ABC transporter permease [Desulfobacteraceae bacterium]
MDLGVIARNFPFMAGGLLLTFELALITIAGGFLVGVVLALCRLSSRSWLYYPATVYVHFFRGLPLILVIFWLYFLSPVVTGSSLKAFNAAIISFVLFEAAYFAEIIRAGVQSLSRGQIMAAYSTGLTQFQSARHVILPQAVRNMVPALVTQAVIIFQDTSLAYVIGLREFLRRVNLVDAREARSVELYLFAGLVYFIICSVGSMAGSRLEKRTKRS